MKLRSLALALALFLSASAFAADDLKAVSCMYEIKSEVLRFARLRHQAAAPLSAPQLQKVKNQLKASVQEIMLNLHESKPGLEKFKMQAQYQKMDGAISELLTESSMGNGSTAVLRDKQAQVMALSDDMAGQLIQKMGTSSARDVAQIGTAKFSVEKLAYDFDECSTDCGKLLAADVDAIQKTMDNMRKSIPNFFKPGIYDMVNNQMLFLKKSVAAKTEGKVDATTMDFLIVTTGNLWKLVDEVLDAYVEKSGG